MAGGLCELFSPVKKEPLECVSPCETEFIALLVGEKHPCVFLAASDDEALLL